MNILLIGSGGREHAIAHALKKNKNVNLVVSPGNPGIEEIANITNLDIKNHSAVVHYCKDNYIDLVVIGPEQPIAEGLSDALLAEHINVFAPSQKAARLETSKTFAKQFMKKYGIPTAEFRTFDKSQMQIAIDYVQAHSLPVVVKADGLAAGKGVVVAQTTEEAVNAVRDMFSGGFGSAGERLVIEEFMDGEEASVFAITDGEDYVTLAPARDHKRALDGDLGKNTGGMGSYAPAPNVDNEVLKKVKSEIIDKTLQGMQKEGYPYKGCLYVGLMIKDGNPKVVEYNCRFGDPETQAVLSIFDGDLAGLLYSAASGRLDKSYIKNISSGFATCVVLASGGYPDKFETGFEIKGLNALPEGVIAYHAGTKRLGDKIITSGGRVIGITATGETLASSIENAYFAVNKVHFENMHYRRDIGLSAINR